MAENLAFKVDSGCYNYNENRDMVIKYGYLYNYNVAMKSCPNGWHLPNNNEWNKLITYLGESQYAGEKLKSTNDWRLHNNKNYGSNESGFSALPSGFCAPHISPSSLNFHTKHIGFWWSATQYNIVLSYRVALFEDNTKINLTDDNISYGYSVRCIKN